MGWQDAPIVGAEKPAEPKAASWQDAPIVSHADVPTLDRPGWQTEQVPSYSPETSAGMGATAVASLASDPMQRLRYFAEQRGISPDRYKIVSGRVAYQGDDGQWHYEESPNYWPRSLGEAGQQIASGAGGAIPATAGGVVGVASAPLMLGGPAGLAVSMGATGAASAGAEAVRQALANEFVSPGEPNRAKIVSEGVQGALGQGIGAGMNAFQQRFVVPDVANYSSSAADALEKKAKKEGIHLTPAESTDLASLKAQQKMLGNMPQSSDDMAAFYERRAKDQIAPAVSRFMGSVSPEESATKAGLSAREAAIQAIEEAYKKRTKEVSPAYRAVVTRENKARSVLGIDKLNKADRVTPSQMKEIADAFGERERLPKTGIDRLLSDPFFKGQVNSVKGNPLYRMQGHDDTSLTVLDQVKKNLDDMIETAKRGGERNKVRLIEQRRTDLLKVADEAFPEYKAARALFESKSPEVEQIAGGVLKSIASLKDTNAQKAASIVFGEGSSPEQIAIARRELERKSPQVWQDLKRSWLQVEWEKANKQTLQGEPVNAGAKWRLRLLGSPAQAARTKAALDPKEFAALQDLADVLQAAGRVKPIGSDTAWNEEIKRLEKERATPVVARLVGNAFSPQKWGELMKDWAADRAMRKHAAEVTQIITSPEARKNMQELLVISPNTAKFRAGVGHLLTRFATSSVGRTAPTREDQLEAQ